MKKNERVSIMMPPEFENTMENLMTIFSSTQDLGITVAGEDMYPTSKHPILRLFLIEKFDLGWAFKDELQAFTFLNYDAAQSFLKRLPDMSAFEMLLMMNAQEDSSESEVGYLS
ncbi:hypothetical protein [Paenisporosarcina antarctica]|uniref:Uncharacterized protein n=1 Tax=Paenisporosarcina antarctica TaxID=417367 RepID=A0A4P7A3H2_9BACL|nr:hypothetical protein [Paenisporosarcina antarctica]QBP43194.1 hypothetical protein E2636_18745 [Paenisporosarcina antarctica]